MSDKEDNKFRRYVIDAQKIIKEFVLERSQLNSKLKNCILGFQSIDSEIYNSLYDAREYYNEKRYEYNKQLDKLKRKKNEYERLWNQYTKEMSSLHEPKVNSNILVSIDYTKRSLEEIEDNITYINEKLEEQILDIDEENEIIEKLSGLEKNKQIKINILAELEQKQTKKLQNDHYYKTQSRIETLENNLRDIYENIINLSHKRLLTHKKMLNLYRKSREFETMKKAMISQLIENKTITDEYHQLFLKLMDHNNKVLLDKLSSRPKREVRPKKIKTPNVEAIIKKKKKVKKLEQKKLAIALDKQKSGKKLDFYEYQLILKHSRNKRN
ncbi:MAG: hypothetical protein ACW98X_21775 [Promethearchaeota archaeon]|jgi:uncharacterized coiled-coil DUF342 family protein